MPLNAATREWLRSRRPAAPPALQSRLESALETGPLAPPPIAATSPDEWAIAERCIDAATALLVELLERPESGREAALDLLTADALVTYAFEAAASRPEQLDALAREAMLRTAALGADPGAAD